MSSRNEFGRTMRRGESSLFFSPFPVMLNLFQHPSFVVMLNSFQHPYIYFMNSGFVYILTNESNTTFYIGVTKNLKRRIQEHKQKLNEGFSSRYNLNKVVWYEWHETIVLAIAKEKRLKNWHRQWKINLITSVNPNFKDLYDEFF